jgi:tRNA(fMet)-specific endonuclease VapC
LTARYLLDTNIISDFIRHPSGKVAEYIRQVGNGSVATSIVVAGELRFGVRKTPESRFATRVEATLQAMQVLALDQPADDAYARTRLALEAAGTPIGANDLLIGAHSLALGLILVTDNVHEFTRIPGLKVENWLR